MLLKPAEATADKDSLAPIALYFPSGYDPRQEEACTWEIQSNKNGSADHFLIGRLPEVDFVGRTRDATSTQLPCRYALGVIDEASGTLRYCEVEGGRVMRVEPRSRSLNYKPTTAGANETLDAAGYTEAKRKLVETFGTSKRQRQLKKRAGTRVSAEGLENPDGVRQLLTEAGEKATKDFTTRDVIMEKLQRERQLPPHNPDAVQPKDAYRARELIPGAAWSALDIRNLKRAVRDRVYRKGELANSGEVHSFALDLMDAVRDGESTAGEERLRAGLYLSALLKLATGSPTVRIFGRKGGIAAEAERQNIEADVLRAVLSGFYEAHDEGDDRVSHVRSAVQQTQMQLHVLALSLIVAGYSLTPLQTDALISTFKMTHAKLVKLFRELGCVTRGSAGGKNKPGKLEVALLPPCAPPKALKEYFPEIQVRKPVGRRRG